MSQVKSTKITPAAFQAPKQAVVYGGGDIRRDEPAKRTLPAGVVVYGGGDIRRD